MKANELRIGNWIKRNGINWRIDRLCSQYGIDPEVSDGCLESDYADFSPIPLTPAILDKVCTGKRSYGLRERWIIESIKIGTSNESPGRYMVFGNVLITNKVLYIDYLHQLQNLFYALTGTELNIEL